MIMRFLALLGIFASAYAQSPQSLLVTPSSLMITVDKTQSSVFLPNVITMSTPDTYVIYNAKVPLYESGILLTPSAGIIYQGVPQFMSLTIVPKDLPSGTTIVPVVFKYYNYSVSISLNIQVAGGPSVAPTKRFIPHVAAGDGWLSYITLANTSSKTESVQIDFLSPSGQPAAFRVGSTPLTAADYTSLTVSVAPNGFTGLYVYPRIAGLQTGTVQVTTLTGGEVKSMVMFQRDGKESSVPSMATAESKLTFPMDTTQGYDMGLVLMNVSSASQIMNLIVYDSVGVILDQRLVALLPNGQTSVTLSSLNNALKYQKGTLQIFCETPSMIGFALRFSPAGQFSAVLN
jgi:hypothetical protein